MWKDRRDQRPLFSEGDDIKKEEEEEEEEEGEDEKIERFFALIKSFRDARDGVRKREPNNIEPNNIEPKTTSHQKKDSGKSAWVPSFQWEDFAEQIEFRKPPLILSSNFGISDREVKIEDVDDKRIERVVVVIGLVFERVRDESACRVVAVNWDVFFASKASPEEQGVSDWVSGNVMGGSGVGCGGNGGAAINFFR
ncbi:hypothetical protein NE237_012574 [Protea cynaroides]|uniref:Uncharacterized protein n=1 Tax=Protea cynaroides TaxID=273540 RepID=A0A9Q0GX11_9MAGN|nr:hypothetical protein NE237_012574 [Protea cynaroides]